MDPIQIALTILILLMAVILIVIGVQIFFILRNLQKALDKIGNILGDAQNLAENITRPVKAMTNLAAVVETGIKVAQSITSKMAEKKEKASRIPDKV